jgi:hypothetical protein
LGQKFIEKPQPDFAQAVCVFQFLVKSFFMKITQHNPIPVKFYALEKPFFTSRAVEQKLNKSPNY